MHPIIKRCLIILLLITLQNIPVRVEARPSSVSLSVNTAEKTFTVSTNIYSVSFDYSQGIENAYTVYGESLDIVQSYSREIRFRNATNANEAHWRPTTLSYFIIEENDIRAIIHLKAQEAITQAGNTYKINITQTIYFYEKYYINNYRWTFYEDIRYIGFDHNKFGVLGTDFGASGIILASDDIYARLTNGMIKESGTMNQYKMLSDKNFPGDSMTLFSCDPKSKATISISLLDIPSKWFESKGYGLNWYIREDRRLILGTGLAPIEISEIPTTFTLTYAITFGDTGGTNNAASAIEGTWSLNQELVKPAFIYSHQGGGGMLNRTEGVYELIARNGIADFTYDAQYVRDLNYFMVRNIIWNTGSKVYLNNQDITSQCLIEYFPSQTKTLIYIPQKIMGESVRIRISQIPSDEYVSSTVYQLKLPKIAITYQPYVSRWMTYLYVSGFINVHTVRPKDLQADILEKEGYEVLLILNDNGWNDTIVSNIEKWWKTGNKGILGYSPLIKHLFGGLSLSQFVAAYSDFLPNHPITWGLSAENVYGNNNIYINDLGEATAIGWGGEGLTYPVASVYEAYNSRSLYIPTGIDTIGAWGVAYNKKPDISRYAEETLELLRRGMMWLMRSRTDVYLGIPHIFDYENMQVYKAAFTQKQDHTVNATALERFINETGVKLTIVTGHDDGWNGTVYASWLKKMLDRGLLEILGHDHSADRSDWTYNMALDYLINKDIAVIRQNFGEYYVNVYCSGYVFGGGGPDTGKTIYEDRGEHGIAAIRDAGFRIHIHGANEFVYPVPQIETWGYTEGEEGLVAGILALSHWTGPTSLEGGQDAYGNWMDELTSNMANAFSVGFVTSSGWHPAITNSTLYPHTKNFVLWIKNQPNVWSAWLSDLIPIVIERNKVEWINGTFDGSRYFLTIKTRENASIPIHVRDDIRSVKVNGRSHLWYKGNVTVVNLEKGISTVEIDVVNLTKPHLISIIPNIGRDYVNSLYFQLSLSNWDESMGVLTLQLEGSGARTIIVDSSDLEKPKNVKINESPTNFVYYTDNKTVKFDASLTSATKIVIEWGKRRYHFYWNFVDMDNQDVSSRVTWRLYNSSQSLTYVPGQDTLLRGIYFLKIYFKGQMINLTSLPTPIHGNTTVKIFLQMKEWNGFYIAFNQTVTIKIYSQTASNLTFIVQGVPSLQIIIESPENASYVEKDGTETMGWIYNIEEKTITIETSTLPAVFTIIFPSVSLFHIDFLTLYALTGSVVIIVIALMAFKWRHKIKFHGSDDKKP